jgi:hypothetical protein
MRLKAVTICLSLLVPISPVFAAQAEDGSLIAGHVDGGDRGRATPLTADHLKAISAWLKAHQANWRANFATPPLPLVSLTLDTSGRKAALRLDLRPGMKRPGWSHSVMMYRAHGDPAGTQTLSAKDLDALLQMLKNSN